MPAPYGVTATGFNAKTLEECREDLKARARAELGSSIDLGDETALGQLIGILADRLADLWQVGQGIYGAAFPESASGLSLDRNAALTGTTRAPAVATQVICTLGGTGGTVIPAGSMVAIPDVADAQFELLNDVVIPGAGVFECTSTGEIYALAGEVTEILSPVTGWATVTNAEDQTVLGSDEQSDTRLRLARRDQIRAQGGSAFEAIRARVLRYVDNVSDCFVFENETDATVDTIPAGAFEVVVRGGLDADIAAAIFAAKPTAIKAHGTTIVAVADSQGDSHNIGFTRPADLNIYVTLPLVRVDARAPADIEDQIKAAVVAYGDLNYRTGSEVIAQALVPSVFSVSAGVVKVDPPYIGTAPSPGTSADITPTRRQIADLDTSRIVITQLVRV